MCFGRLYLYLFYVAVRSARIKFPMFLIRNLGWEGQLAKHLTVSRLMVTGMVSIFRVSCNWEVGVRRG